VNLEQARVDHALEAQRMSNISVAQPATFDSRPVAPHTAINLALGLLVGGFGGVGLALFKDHLSPAVRRPQQSAPRAVIPVLGRIPYVRVRRSASSGSGKGSLRSSYTDA
jgi:capsular polysaccharide biosynthesis protein